METILQGIGFRDIEAKVYLAALELGESAASEIAKKARLKRPTVYVILKDLIRRGLIDSYRRRGITRFTAKDPKLVISEADLRAHAAKEALPELLALYKTADAAKPRIQYFDGHEGLRRIMEDTMSKPGGQILVWSDLAITKKGLGEYYDEYARRRMENKIFVRGIIEDNEAGREFKNLEENGACEVRLVPHEKYDFNDEIMVYGDKAAVISHRHLLGIVIQNKLLADTARAIFKLSWERAENLTDE